MSFLSREKIDKMGFAHVVENSRLSDQTPNYSYVNMAMTLACFLPKLAV